MLQMAKACDLQDESCYLQGRSDRKRYRSIGIAFGMPWIQFWSILSSHKQWRWQYMSHGCTCFWWRALHVMLTLGKTWVPACWDAIKIAAWRLQRWSHRVIYDVMTCGNVIGTPKASNLPQLVDSHKSQFHNMRIPMVYHEDDHHDPRYQLAPRNLAVRQLCGVQWRASCVYLCSVRTVNNRVISLRWSFKELWLCKTVVLWSCVNTMQRKSVLVQKAA